MACTAKQFNITLDVKATRCERDCMVQFTDTDTCTWDATQADATPTSLATIARAVAENPQLQTVLIAAQSTMMYVDIR